jgi:hypothetical protein
MLRYRLSRLFATPTQNVNDDVIRREYDEIYEYEGIGVVLKVQDPSISLMYSIDRVITSVMTWVIESTAVDMTARCDGKRQDRK